VENDSARCVVSETGVSTSKTCARTSDVFPPFDRVSRVRGGRLWRSGRPKSFDSAADKHAVSVVHPLRSCHRSSFFAAGLSSIESASWYGTHPTWRDGAQGPSVRRSVMGRVRRRLTRLRSRPRFAGLCHELSAAWLDPRHLVAVETRGVRAEEQRSNQSRGSAKRWSWQIASDERFAANAIVGASARRRESFGNEGFLRSERVAPERTIAFVRTKPSRMDRCRRRSNLLTSTHLVGSAAYVLSNTSGVKRESDVRRHTSEGPPPAAENGLLCPATAPAAPLSAGLDRRRRQVRPRRFSAVP
jgi:hypothetical protein